MYALSIYVVTLVLSSILAAFGKNLVLTNDDGWAVAQIRAQFEALDDAGFEVVLSSPAENMSGTGSLSAVPIPLIVPCEYDSCPVGSPAEGYNASEPRFNYVNAFPADAASYGVKTLAPQFFDATAPDFVVSGPNIGTNLGLVVQFSGTIGAAAEAARLGIPSAAFAGDSGSQVSYTTLQSTPSATSTLSSYIYASLTTYFVKIITDAGLTPILPSGVFLSVNYPSIDDCPAQSDFKWVLSRNLDNIFATDVELCGSTTLPSESTVVGTSGCYASVTVLDAETKLDVGSTLQAEVLMRLSDLPLSCLPN